MELRQAVAHGFNRRLALIQFTGHQMGNSFGIGFGLELAALSFEHGAQFGKIFDNAVMNDSKALCNMRMRIAFYWFAMCCPARMTNADHTGKWFTGQTLFKIDQLALRTATVELAPCKVAIPAGS